jgi:hypothetical protein
MTKIGQDDWLTDELMQQARKLIEDIDGVVSEGTVYTVSRALHLAEKRGEERERERCANVAGIHGGKAMLRLGLAFEERSTKSYRDKLQCEMETAEAIASAIRSGS